MERTTYKVHSGLLQGPILGVCIVYKHALKKSAMPSHWRMHEFYAKNGQLVGTTAEGLSKAKGSRRFEAPYAACTACIRSGFWIPLKGS